MTKYANWDLIQPFDGPTAHDVAEIDLFVHRRFRAECARVMAGHHRGDVYRFSSSYVHDWAETTGRCDPAMDIFDIPVSYDGEWMISPSVHMPGIDVKFFGQPMIPRWIVSDVRERLRYIIDWVRTLDRRGLSKLPRMSFMAAYRRADDWHERIERTLLEEARVRMHTALREVDDNDPIAGRRAVGWNLLEGDVRAWDPAATYAPDDLVRFGGRIYFGADVERIRALAALPVEPVGEGERLDLDDGWYWAWLATKEALQQESRRMGHCVGHGAYDNLVSAVLPAGIWSLRHGNESVATVEIGGSMIPGGNRIRQAKGPRNRTLPEAHRLLLKVLRDRYDIEGNGESLTRAEIKEIYGECHPLGIVPTPDADVDDDVRGIGGL